MKEIRIYVRGSYFPDRKEMLFSFLIRDEEGEITKTGRVDKIGSSLEAEYFGLFKAIEYIKYKRKRLTFFRIYSTNQIMVRQLKGRYKVHNPELRILCSTILEKLSSTKWDIEWIPKDEMNAVFSQIPSIYSKEKFKKLIDAIDIEEEDVWV